MPGFFSGMELSEEELTCLREKNAAALTKARAVRILTATSVSGRELQHRLEQKGSSPENAEDTVRWLEELQLLNDRQLAEAIVRRESAKGYGKARIRQTLYQKKIPRELWDEALERMPEMDDLVAEFLQKRFGGTKPDEKERKRAVDALVRRGHTWETIQNALDRYLTAFRDTWEEMQ